jgi:hypothetical protein
MNFNGGMGFIGSGSTTGPLTVQGDLTVEGDLVVDGDTHLADATMSDATMDSVETKTLSVTEQPFISGQSITTEGKGAGDLLDFSVFDVKKPSDQTYLEWDATNSALEVKETSNMIFQVQSMIQNAPPSAGRFYMYVMKNPATDAKIVAVDSIYFSASDEVITLSVCFPEACTSGDEYQTGLNFAGPSPSNDFIYDSFFRVTKTA